MTHPPRHVTASTGSPNGLSGRNIDSHLLRPSGLLAADEHKQPQNAFGFAELDPHGHGCPLGSHVRRANPRDGLARNLASAPALLDCGEQPPDPAARPQVRPHAQPTSHIDDGAERGLLFICLQTPIFARQFEFIQQTWLLNKNFATLYDETDPLMVPKGRFTIPEQPLRRIVDVQTFIQLAGGEYFSGKPSCTHFQVYDFTLALSLVVGRAPVGTRRGLAHTSEAGPSHILHRRDFGRKRKYSGSRWRHLSQRATL